MDGAAVLLMLILALRVSRRGVIFIVLGAVLTVAQFATRPFADALAAVLDGAQLAAFIAAFFTALATLRDVADTSPAIGRCGRFLAQQPPGRRYGALTVGGQLFSLVLNYGAIALLGSLAMASAREEQNAEIRRHRMRRMLLAIQRGFISVLPWSPLSFAIAITTTLIPGASWGAAVLPALVTGALLAGIGYALDTLFKPKITGPRPPRLAPDGTWASVLPLLALLGILMALVGGIASVADVRVAGIVIVVVPVLSLIWLVMQGEAGERWRATKARIVRYTFEVMPSYRGEITLLMMAGYIGTTGADLLVPVVVSAGVDLATLPTALILVGFVWLIPVAGQLGMNPILAVSLVAPLIPAASVLGVSPTAIVVAITAGWALSGASSPFTATTLLVGSFASISATRVGLSWNGVYSLLCALALSIWVVAYATL
ncbi:MAG: hypothetical protein AAGF49_16200, partial [Pseudomonadota bacterium]